MELALSIEQMKHLKELGVDISKASMWWCRIVRPACPPTKKEKVMVDWFLSLRKEHMHTELDVVEYVSAFILDDILDLLPKEIQEKDNHCTSHLEMIFPNDNLWEVTYSRNNGSVCESFFDKKLIGAAYKMLCWVAENNYLNTNSN